MQTICRRNYRRKKRRFAPLVLFKFSLVVRCHVTTDARTAVKDWQRNQDYFDFWLCEIENLAWRRSSETFIKNLGLQTYFSKFLVYIYRPGTLIVQLMWLMTPQEGRNDEIEKFIQESKIQELTCAWITPGDQTKKLGQYCSPGLWRLERRRIYDDRPGARLQLN